MVTLKGAHRRQFIESFFAADVDDLSTFSGRRVVGATRLLAARCAGCGGAAALRSVGGRAADRSTPTGGPHAAIPPGA